MINSHSRTYYPFLDALRAIAATWVIFYHINIFFDLNPILKSFYPYFFKIVHVGELGVDIFFVISGFLISGLLFSDLDSNIRVKRFYGRRFFKIIPQYLIAVFVSLIILRVIEPFTVNYITIDPIHHNYIIKSFGSHNDASVINHIFFCQNFTKSILILNHTWSLAVEEHFYLCFPLLMAGVCKLQPELKLRRRLLLISFLVLIALAFLIKFYYIKIKLQVPHVSTLYRYDALIFGCLLRLLEPSFKSIRAQQWRVVAPVLLLIGVGIFLSFIVFGFDKTKIFSYSLAYVAAGCLIISFLREEVVPFQLNFLVRDNFLRWIGRSSYALYLWHLIILYLFFKLQGVIPDWLNILLYFVTSVLVGHFSTVTIEKYFLNIRKKIFP